MYPAFDCSGLSSKKKPVLQDNNNENSTSFTLSTILEQGFDLNLGNLSQRVSTVTAKKRKRSSIMPNKKKRKMSQ
jgi:hypothetical protein